MSSFQASGSTQGATQAINDPGLDCGDNTINNSVWFTIEGINAGTATVTVAGIDNNPGLEMEIYTGGCGSLAPVAGACTSANGPAGSMTLNFSVASGITYYIMVDGSAGNEEAFTIVATATNNAEFYCTQSDSIIRWKQHYLQLDYRQWNTHCWIRCRYKFYHCKCRIAQHPVECLQR